MAKTETKAPKAPSNKVKHLTTPLTTEKVKDLKAGDMVMLSGTIYTGRDMAHKKMVEALDAKEPLPMDIKDQIIYYVGPCPPKPGQAMGSCGPTSSYRMDPYAPQLLDQGLKGMIGKGPRAPEVIEAMKKNQAVYFAAIGGAAAIIAHSVEKAEPIAYQDLGPEAIYKIEIKDFFCIVAIDSQGNDLYKTGPPKYRKTKA